MPESDLELIGQARMIGYIDHESIDKLIDQASTDEGKKALRRIQRIKELTEEAKADCS